MTDGRTVAGSVVVLAVTHEHDPGRHQPHRQDEADHADGGAHREVEGAAERTGQVGIDRQRRDEAERDEREPPGVAGVGLQRGQRAGFGRGAMRLGRPPPRLGGHSDHRRYQQPHQQQGYPAPRCFQERTWRIGRRLLLRGANVARRERSAGDREGDQRGRGLFRGLGGSDGRAVAEELDGVLAPHVMVVLEVHPHDPGPAVALPSACIRPMASSRAS